MDYLNRLRAAVTEKDEIEKVLVGGFSTLVAAASPGMPSRHDPRYYTAPLGSPSVYATPAAPNFTRRQRHGAHTKESIVESSLRNLHNTAMDELEASSVQGAPKTQGTILGKSTRGFLGRILDFLGIF